MYSLEDTVNLDIIIYLPDKKVWTCVYNSTGLVYDLHIWSVHKTKRDALLRCIELTGKRASFEERAPYFLDHLQTLHNALSDECSQNSPPPF